LCPSSLHRSPLRFTAWVRNDVRSELFGGPTLLAPGRRKTTSSPPLFLPAHAPCPAVLLLLRARHIHRRFSPPPFVRAMVGYVLELLAKDPPQQHAPLQLRARPQPKPQTRTTGRRESWARNRVPNRACAGSNRRGERAGERSSPWLWCCSGHGDDRRCSLHPMRGTCSTKCFNVVTLPVL
jgi:hypothetical protein